MRPNSLPVGAARDWRGYDPYDALNSPAAPFLTLGTQLGRRLLTQAVKLSPVNVQPTLGALPLRRPDEVPRLPDAKVLPRSHVPGRRALLRDGDRRLFVKLVAVDAELIRCGRLRDLRDPRSTVAFEKKHPAREQAGVRSEPILETVIDVQRGLSRTSQQAYRVIQKLYSGVDNVDRWAEEISGFTAGTVGGNDTPLMVPPGLMLAERADPTAPPANNGDLYVRDNGSGKSQLCVRFPTGAVQVIATEP
jgi:hypothetical protein